MKLIKQFLNELWYCITEWKKGKGFWASDGLVEKRLKICDDCNLLEKGKCFPRCTVCGCFIKLKTKLEMEQCPVEKW